MKNRDSLIELICATCGAPMTAAENSLECRGGHTWKIVDSIPRLVEGENHYSAAFGLQWRTFRKTQLDSYTGVPLSYERGRRCLGESVYKSLHGSDPYYVLEAGCGAGRFTEILLKAPHAHVFSVDSSDAVDANQLNFSQNERHRIFQADIVKLPFSPHQFDLVFCLGTIEHTPSPEETIAKLYQQVKPGGSLVFDHYHLGFRSLTRFGATVFRLFMKHLSPESGLRCTERLVRMLFPLHRTVRNVPSLRAVLSRVSPLLTYFHRFPELSDHLQYEWALLDTHDALTDWYKHPRSIGQIKRILGNLGAAEVQVVHGGNGIEARCRRPA